MPPPTMADGRRQTRVLMACSGLGVIVRGYEAFMRTCFQALRDDPRLDVRLFKGGGAQNAAERTLAHFPRESVAARIMGEVTGRGPYVVEQASFAASLLPHLARERPDVVYFCDPAVGKVLQRWRRFRGSGFRLLFHNGGPQTPPFPWCDHIHQVSPVAVADAVAAGESADRQTLLPSGLDIGAPPVLALPEQRAGRRRALGFPADRPVVLSVGAVNRGHKRMDYLIREIAAMPAPRPFLVMLGQQETDTPAVRVMATLLLGEDGFAIHTVPKSAVGPYYHAADVFVLASLREGFGLAYAEALAHGLPCIAHDFPVARFVLGDYGIFTDLSRPGALVAALDATLGHPTSVDQLQRRYCAAVDRFSWGQLAPHYAEMLRRCAGHARQPLLASA